jgi:tetratricopeptide (TPR) repeat protein
MMIDKPEAQAEETELTTALRALAHDSPAIPAFHQQVMARAQQLPLLSQMPEEEDPRLIAALQALASDVHAAPAFYERVMARAQSHRLSAMHDSPTVSEQAPSMLSKGVREKTSLYGLAQGDPLYPSPWGRLHARLLSVIQWLRKMHLMQAMVPAAVTVGLVLACIWPRLWALGQEVQALRAQLQQAQQQQQVASQQAHNVQEQLIAHVEDFAYQSFGVGKYDEATSRYLENSQWEPERALEYAIKAATAAWYGCQYDAALRLLESRLGNPGDTILQHFVLGTIYHSLERLGAAQEQYEQVIAHGPSARLEAAWFNLGVVHALRFRQTHDAAALQSAIAAVQQSAAVARTTSRRQYQTRLEMIAKALEPVEQRPPNACGYGYHTTQDLTALSGVSSFTDWLHAQQRAVEQST